MEIQPEHPSGEIKRLQRCINDLVSLLGLAAIWSGGDPSQVLDTLLDALMCMLSLDLVSVRLTNPVGEAPVEIVKIAQLRGPMPPTHEICEALSHSFGNPSRKWPPLLRNLMGEGDVSIMPLPLGLQGELGVIVAAVQRADFPQQTEALLLSVAASQASIGLQEARLLSQQKRIATELDRRVAQRTAELAAANAELQLQVGLLQQIPVAAWTLRSDGTPDFANQKWLEYTGQVLDYVQSHPDGWMTAVHPEDREKASKSFWQGIRSGQGFTMEARFRRARDGAYRWHLNRAAALRDEEGNLLKFVGTSTDIEDLKQSQENLRQMTETIPEMLWSATSKGAIDYCNSRLLDYTGFSAEEVIGNGWTKLLHPDDIEQAARMWMSSVTSGAPYRVEVRTFHAADRTYRWCVMNALPLLDQQEHILKWHGTVVDMHDWKQSQEELRVTQADLAHMTRATTIGELTASIAHEVNQPLSGIITNASTCLRMLAADPPNVEGARETVRRTIRDGNRASEVITRLRALFSRKSAMPQSMDLNEATREVIALSLGELHKNRVILRTELAQDLPLVTGDRIQLQQVISNLFRNASDAMSGVDDRPRELLIKTECDDGDRVRLSVKDAGVGFAPQATDKLFQTFFTTKSDGMGIGLSISRSIIEAHRGRLWATPNNGPGVTFSFSVPCRPVGLTSDGTRASQTPSVSDAA
ncbi:MAG: PAS domain-containing protein [Candidatus Sulfotelmatobacter sp.]